MEGFYIAVLVIAVVILMLILTTLGVAMRKGNADVAWPPGNAAECPEGWVRDTIANKCAVPDGLINSGKIYTTYNTDSTPQLASYKESSNWETTTIPYIYVAGSPAKYKVNITKDVPEVLFTPYRPIKIDTVDTLVIGVVDPVVSVKPYFTTTSLTPGMEYDVYATLSDLSIRNSAGKAKAQSTSILEFITEPKVAISNTTLYISDGHAATSIAGHYTAGSSSVSFTVTGTAPTTSGTLTFKKGSVDFNDATYTRCGKKVFAKKYNLIWDGVSNYNKCP